MFSYVPVFADEAADSGLSGQVLGQLNAGAGAEATEKPLDPRLIVAYVIQVALALLGIIFIFLLLMSGYWFLTARGEEEKVNKAKSTVTRAIIGLLVVMLAYALVAYLLGGLEGVVKDGNNFFSRRRL